MKRQIQKPGSISAALLLMTFAMSGCAPVQRYHPQPIAPAVAAARFEGRTLSDPGLRRFMEKSLGHSLSAWPIEFWTPKDLTLAAFYFNPQIPIARAQAETAEAAIITAGARPNPSLSLMPGIPSPYLFDLVVNFPVVRAHRRAIKIQQAKALSAAARYGLAQAAWNVRSGLRTAALNYFLAQRRQWIAETEETLRARQVQWLSARLAAGEVAKPQVETARLGLLDARAALRGAQGQVAVARAALAAAIGVPVSAIEGIHYSWTSLDNPPSASRFSSAAIERDAVLNRLDVRKSLAEYAASEAALQLEIAKQHPDFQIGPGYQFEERDNFFTLSYSVTLPIFNRNQGPIAEAEARRKEAAAAFVTTQADAIAQSEEALARYRAAFAELDEARETLAQMQGVQEPAARQAMMAGEADRLFYNNVELEGTAVTNAYLNVLSSVQEAFGQLEDSVERPLESGDISPPIPQAPELKGSSRREDTKP
jgi:outer membrane protein, heavy metal efflux system